MCDTNCACGGNGGSNACNLPLAIASVPMQKFRKLYQPDQGWRRGTIFAELDLPFKGRSQESEGCRYE
ncbi:MAG: spore coat associated protein CotJA [Oscillospiraceae bacterium]|nr:spore coat associated protein CotJA [Oscillospiraceae bacterium]